MSGDYARALATVRNDRRERPENPAILAAAIKDWDTNRWQGQARMAAARHPADRTPTDLEALRRHPVEART